MESKLTLAWKLVRSFSARDLVASVWQNLSVRMPPGKVPLAPDFPMTSLQVLQIDFPGNWLCCGAQILRSRSEIY